MSLYTITLPSGRVAEFRAPTAADVLDVGIMADRPILARIVKAVDGKKRAIGDPLSIGQRDYLALWGSVRARFLQPEPWQEDACEGALEAGGEPGQVWVPVPSGVVKEDDGTAKATLWILLQETDAETHNEQMRTVRGATAEERASQFDAAALRMTKLAVRAERCGDVVKPMNAMDLAVWPYTLPDLWTLRIAWQQMVTPTDEDLGRAKGSVRPV